LAYPAVATFFNKLTILPRWVIIIIDFCVLSVAALLGYLLRFNFDWNNIAAYQPLNGILLLATSGIIASLVTRSYAGIVRYTGIDDALKILLTSLLGLSITGFSNLIYYYNTNHNLIPYSVIVIFFSCSVIGLLFYRLMVKNIYSYYKIEINQKCNVIIFGAGHRGISTKQALDADIKGKYRIVGFLEDDSHKIGKVVQGVKIYPSRYLPKLVRSLKIREVIISIRELSQERKNHLVDVCLRYHLKVKVVPSFEDWVSGNLNPGQIREVNIEDLLGRPSISLDDSDLRSSLQGKRVCITGAAGSIGSELARQVLKYHPKELILIDQAESALYDLERELLDKSYEGMVCFYLADITNQERIRNILSEHSPEIFFHAAAYKHVPLIESNPSEAIRNNIQGTRILADLAVEVGVRKFVMISTDKAVNPTNVMGCSKRIAEIYVQSLNNHLDLIGNDRTRFITTRFGNVLGSNGSVIPLFQKQIDTGGPITVTHPEVIRYFMTIPEACRLVLEAGIMGSGGEIFLFDMGRPVKIYDLARKMALLAGLEPGKDIDIIFTGLRDGEKLYEELLSVTENTIPTHHNKILKAKVAEYEYSKVLRNLEFLEELVHDRNELKMVAMMKEMVPEFKSNYSRFEVLDRSSLKMK
jgi:FlaA1/EpsC-like NDP-sugar epimerase